MQPNAPKDIRNQPMQRQRPLQKSMFLPEQYPPQQSLPNRGQVAQFASFNPMKRSTAAMEGIPQSNLTPTNTFHHNSFSFNQVGFNSSMQQFPNDGRGQNQQDMLFHNGSLNVIKTSQQLSAHKIETSELADSKLRMFSKNQKGVQGRLSQPMPPNLNSIQSIETANTIQQIISQIKERHLPQLISKATTQIYDYIYNLRMQLQVLKQELKSFTKKQEVLNADYQTKIKNNSVINFNSNHVNNISTPRNKKDGKQADLADLQTNFFLLESKISQIQAKIGESGYKMTQQFERMQSRFDNQLKDKNQARIKVSSIKSSLPLIMLEYKQMFAYKKLEPSNFKPSFQDQQISISSAVYYIDKQGYLLDNQSRYITDQKGTQIRLDEKHIKLLQNHRLLQR